MLILQLYEEKQRIAIRPDAIVTIEEMDFDPPGCGVTLNDGRRYLVAVTFDKALEPFSVNKPMEEDANAT